MPICGIIANDDEPVQTETVEIMLINCAYLNGGERLRMKYWRGGVGFDPTIRFPVYTLSKRAPSATRPSLRLWRRQYSRRPWGDNPKLPYPCRPIRRRPAPQLTRRTSPASLTS